MIYTDKLEAEKNEFEDLLNQTLGLIKNSASSNSGYYMRRSATEFEVDVKEAMDESSKGTKFEGAIILHSGHAFPDIVANRFYGVEVKTNKKSDWKSIGNSVLESTRVADVDRIYLFFARLTDPIAFKCRLYQECLYNIAVTHSPRYLIDMDLDVGDTIFDKMGIDYDDLRLEANPLMPVVNYFRSICSPGEETWWMGELDATEAVVSPTVKLFSSLPIGAKNFLRNEAMARFPSIFGRSNSKYLALATWLAARHGVVHPSLRDSFSASGRVQLNISGTQYARLPKVFEHLHRNITLILDIVRSMDKSEAKHHWGLQYEPNAKERIREWCNLVLVNSKELLQGEDRFIAHLLSLAVKDDEESALLLKTKLFYNI